MKNTFKFALIILVVLMAGCGQVGRATRSNDVSVTGSGNVVAREVELSGFNRLEAGLHFDITVRQGEEYGVVVYSDDNFVDYVYVEQQGTTLVFGLDPDYAYNFYGVTMRAEVTMPELAGLQLDSSSHATLAGPMIVEDVTAELTGSSSLSGDVEGGTVNLDVDGNAYAELAGSAESLVLDVCGNSVTDLSALAAQDATLNASCVSTVVVNVAGRLAGDASQNASVFYVGQPASVSLDAHEGATVQLQ